MGTTLVSKTYHIIGVMSGTSLDGIDLVYVRFSKTKAWHFNIQCAQTVPYPKAWETTLSQLVLQNRETLAEIDYEYTIFLAQIIEEFITKNQIKNITAICSHGHTALHQPHKGLTYQIGNLPKLANLTGQTVVCDFRVQDVALGGQGAPLVPIGDLLLFPQYTFCLNLGGFANISTQKNNERIAFDICPVNIVLNYYANTLGYRFDESGTIAASGEVDESLLHALNNLDFYSQPYPKSLGLEWVKSCVFPIIETYKLSVPNILRTVVEHIAIQIGNALNATEMDTLLVTGGGAYNHFLITRLNVYSKAKIEIPDCKIVEFKEALIFGFLGVLKLNNEINTLKSVTGASQNHSSGKIFKP